MRKLLVLLSVVLLFALCQSQKVKEKKKPPKFQRECLFGFKKVNNTKVCKTKEEFLKHPRNDTNCTTGKRLKKIKVNNSTFYRCVLIRPVRPSDLRDGNCTQPGFVKRCKKDRFTGKNVCKCIRLGPGPVKDPNPDVVCEDGKVKHCKKNGVCICRPLRPVKPTTVYNGDGLY